MSATLSPQIENQFKKFKIKFTDQRKAIVNTILESNDHPDVEQIFERSLKYDKNLNLATVYRTINLLEDVGLLRKHYFGDNRARYELTDEINHHHLIDIDSKTVQEFSNSEIEDVVKRILDVMGYDLIRFNLDVYGSKRKDKADYEL